MNEIDKLTEYFTRFPGVGIRQARRFVYYLLSRDQGTRKSLAHLIESLSEAIFQCSLCSRFSSEQKESGGLCDICTRSDRRNPLLVVEKDADLERIEKSGAFRGRYFILGGTVPIGSDNPSEHIRLSQLLKHLKNTPKDLEEVILGLSITPDGEHTGEILKEEITPLLREPGWTLTHLGRGLSTGSELEYADRATIESALEGRKK